MRIRVWTWVLVLGLAAPVIGGCPGDGEGEATGGTGGNASGDGDGDGEAGASGTSGDGDGDGPAGGGGTGGGSSVTPEQAAMGECDMNTGSDSCTGLDAYASCVETMCNIQECYDGPCASLISCYQNAADPCNANCTESTECESCFTDKLSCLTSCYSQHVMCEGVSGGGGTEPGGGCDQLDECCASLQGDLMTSCTSLADGIRLAGDDACAMLIPSYCPGSG